MGKVLTLAVAAAFLSPVCSAEPGLVIARKGKSDYRIVVPNDRSAGIDYAASELQKYLKEISGAKLPIVTEKQAAKSPAFLLGPCKRIAKTGLVDKARKLTGDGVLIKTVGGDIVLLGDGHRGQLYSVYLLLERYLGCRFLAQDCTITPKRDPLTLPSIDYSYSPPFIYREELYYDAATWALAARQRINGGNMHEVLRRTGPNKQELIPGIAFHPFGHSSSVMIPPDKYFATHPEYFGLVNGQRHAAAIGGQLCFTNPDVLRIAEECVDRWVAENPSLASVDISQNDAYPGSSGACECAKCAAIVKEEGSQIGPILRFVNEIADYVARKYPGKHVDTLAYSYTITPPKITKPRDNVFIRLCHQGCYFHGVEAEDMSRDFRAAIDGWHKIAKNVFIWHYATCFNGYLAPNPNLNGLAKDLKYYASHGVNGVMIQGDYQSPGGELAEIRQYLSAQLLWDPSQDPMAIRKDFCDGYYGPASAEAIGFLALYDQLANKEGLHGYGSWNPPDVADPEFVKSGLAILNRALGKANDDVYRNHIEKLMMPLWFLQLCWPDRYGASKDDCRALLARFKEVVKRNGIVNVSEAYVVNNDGTSPLVQNMDDFIAGLEATYAPPSEGK
jgi:hypothetical protein